MVKVIQKLGCDFCDGEVIELCRTLSGHILSVFYKCNDCDKLYYTSVAGFDEVNFNNILVYTGKLTEDEIVKYISKSCYPYSQDLENDIISHRHDVLKSQLRVMRSGYIITQEIMGDGQFNVDILSHDGKYCLNITAPHFDTVWHLVFEQMKKENKLVL